MDIDRIYQLMGAGAKRLYGYFVRRPVQRWNVDNRAERAIERQREIPKVAPRHDGTAELFRTLATSNPEVKRLHDKSNDLLNRMSTFKVVSTEHQLSDDELREINEIKDRVRSRLPQSRDGTEIPIHAYVEPDVVPVGRISLIRSLDFIGKHSKYPDQYDAATIAAQHRLRQQDVTDVLNYFKPFYRVDKDADPEIESSKVLGLTKNHLKDIVNYLKPKNADTIAEQITGDSSSSSSSSGGTSNTTHKATTNYAETTGANETDRSQPSLPVENKNNNNNSKQKV